MTRIAVKDTLLDAQVLRTADEGPAVTFNGQQVIVAQALLWPGAYDLPEGQLPVRPV
jgi:hypothetical protein